MNALYSKLGFQSTIKREPKTNIEEGFTLIELMVVITIIGLLASASINAFTGAQAKAVTGTIIGSMQAYARECANRAITGDSSNIVTAVGAIEGMTFSNLDCTTATTITADRASDATKIGGLRCGNTASGSVEIANGVDENTCSLSISVDGTITGAWSAM